MLAVFDSRFLTFIPHGHCYLWKPDLVWLHVSADGLIALAYFSISLALIHFVRQRQDLPYAWIFQLFGVFITACGLTHVMEIWTLWYPTYWISGELKAATAMISSVTTAALIFAIPQALTLPNRRELEAAKVELEQQVRDRTRSLRLSEERLQLALAGSGDGLWDWNISTGEVYFSPRWHEMLGYKAGELPERVSTWQMLIHPEDEPWVMKLLNHHMQDPQIPYTFDYRLRTQSGDWTWIGCYGRVVAYDDRGHPIRMAGTHKDIRDRKAAEAALAESQQRYRDLVENSPDIIERFDRQLRHLYVSPALTEITGLAADAFLGKTCRDLGMDEVMVNRWEAAAAALLSTGHRQAIEFSTPTLKGVRWFEMAIVPELSDQRTIASILCISRDITDRKQAEADRLQTEKIRLEFTLLETLLDITLAGYWDWDIPNHREYMSPGLKRMFGYADHELPNLPETWQNLIFAEDLPEVLECFDRHVQSRGEVPYYNEVRYRHKDGSTIWIICVGHVIDWDTNGQPLRMIGCHIDITQRKQAEAQLQKSDAHLKLAQRIGKLGSWELDLHTQKVIWSDQVFRIFGRDAATHAPSLEELQQLLHPDDRTIHQQTIETAIATAQPYELECRTYRSDGTLVYMQAKGEPILDAAGQVVQLAGTVLDITERKQAEVALMQSEATNRALMSAIPDLLIWIHQDGTYLDARGSGKSLKLTKPLSELAGAKIYDILPAEQVQERMYYIQQALQTNELQVYEYQITVADTIRDEEARIVMCGDQQVLCMVRDITDRKRVEEQLLQTTAQLQASNRELEAFAYSVSHDLRSPLRAIDGFSKALLEDYGDQFDDEGKDYFDRIRRNVQRMGMLIDDLLRLSRVSRSEMRYTVVNLSALVQEQVQELQVSEPSRRVECVIAPHAIVTADLTLMRVVISNLLQNAWKFTNHHSCARIEFGIIKQDEWPVYFIRDDGAGFDMTYSSMLFGVFQRLHNTHEFPGTGIGLATVQRAIHRHGGRVWAEAAVEQGATIYFTVPSPSNRARA